MLYVPLTLSAQNDANAQKPKLFSEMGLKNFTLGINGGVGLPAVLGSLNLNNHGTKPQLAYGAYLGYSFTQHLELLLNYQGGKLRGTYNSKEFNTELTAAMSAKLRLSTGGLSFVHSKPIVALFIQGGAGYALYKPDFNNNQQLGNQFATVGAGLSIHIATPLSLVLGYDMNFLQKNFMYVNPADHSNVAIPSSKWSYAYAGLEFHFGGKGQPKKWYNPVKTMYDELSESASSAELAEIHKQISTLSNKVDDLYKDSDGDGVPDYRDKEPNTPAGVPVDGAGRAIHFPEPPAPVEVATTVPDKPTSTSEPSHDVTPGNKGTIHFAFDSANLIGDSENTLRELANSELKNATRIILEGYTCNIGTTKYNYGLGLRRANSIKRVLVRFGIPSSDITVKSYGKTRPAYPNDSKEHRKLNRRVEIKVQN
ncbi:MAG: OmpA family protein [Solitalea-like symbiont of Tyrophagus putrescentiae]